MDTNQLQDLYTQLQRITNGLKWVEDGNTTITADDFWFVLSSWRRADYIARQLFTELERIPSVELQDNS